MKPDPQSDIRAAFKERRLRLGLTEGAMADELGMSRMAYHRLEQHSRLTPELRVLIDATLLSLEAELSEQISH